MRPLHTTLCTLEPQVEAHAAEMFGVLTDPAIYEFERVPPPSVERLAAGYRRLELRRSPDGSEQWLNWVVRLPTGELTGYVQATVIGNVRGSVRSSGRAYVAYEFASRYWRRGLATAAVTAMRQELQAAHGVADLIAVVKQANFRSLGLLGKLGFRPATAVERVAHEDDEVVLVAPVVAPSHG